MPVMSEKIQCNPDPFSIPWIAAPEFRNNDNWYVVAFLNREEAPHFVVMASDLTKSMALYVAEHHNYTLESEQAPTKNLTDNSTVPRTLAADTSGSLLAEDSTCETNASYEEVTPQVEPSKTTRFEIDLPEAEATFLSVTAAHQEMSESCLVKCALRVYQLAMKGKLVSNEPVYGCGGDD